jgi:hypothetical protein
MFPSTVDAPSSEVVVDGFPRREFMGQQAPSTATSDDVEDGVKDLISAVLGIELTVARCRYRIGMT